MRRGTLQQGWAGDGAHGHGARDGGYDDDEMPRVRSRSSGRGQERAARTKEATSEHGWLGGRGGRGTARGRTLAAAAGDERLRPKLRRALSSLCLSLSSRLPFQSNRV